MSGIFYKTLIVLLSAGVSVLTIKWSADKHELRAETAANVTLRKLLDEMVIGMTEKQRQIDRLSQSSCGSSNKTEQTTGKHAVSGPPNSSPPGRKDCLSCVAPACSKKSRISRRD